MKKFITKVLIFAFAIGGMMALASCGGGTDTISKSKAKRILNKEMTRTHQDMFYGKLPVGFFECNDNDVRYQLRQLAANDIITYNCTKVMKTERVRHSRQVQQGFFYTYYTTEYYYTNEKVPTYFVEVALTDKGRKIVVDSIPEVVDPLEADLKQPDIDYDNFPESKVDPDEFPEPPAAVKPIAATESEEYEPVPPEEGLDDFDPEEVSEQVVNTNSDNREYDQAKAREHVEEVIVIAGENKLVKVRNIRVGSHRSEGAQCEVVLERANVTPFGRIYGHMYNGQRILAKARFIYYEDRGWVVKSDDDD